VSAEKLFGTPRTKLRLAQILREGKKGKKLKGFEFMRTFGGRGAQRCSIALL
jgi:hypothetical protein